MPLQAKIERLKQEAALRAPPSGVPAKLFQAFVNASVVHLRSPFLSRHSETECVDLLATAFEGARRYQGPIPSVHHRLDGNILSLWTVMPDQSFVVDTIHLMLRRRGWEYLAGFNLMVAIGRAEDGSLRSIDGPGDKLESITWLIAEVPDTSKVDDAVATLQGSLRLCQALFTDYAPSLDLLSAQAKALIALSKRAPELAADLRESADFLKWLITDNFVFMGLSVDDQRLGVLRSEFASLWDGSSAEQGWVDGPLVAVRKGQLESQVHRAGRVDEIKVQIPAVDGEPARTIVIQGLFTYRAVTQPSRHIPWLRRTLASILSQQHAQPGSYPYKGVSNVFDSLPTEFLFTATEAEVSSVIERVMEAEQQQDARAHLVQRADSASTFALIAMPKGRWSETMRERLQQVLLAATGATYSDHGVFMGRFDTMLVHFYMTGGRRLDESESDAAIKALIDIATPWIDRLYWHIVQTEGAARATEQVFRWGEAFDPEYRRMTTVEHSLRDIRLLDSIGDSRSIAADVFLDGEGRPNLRIFQRADILLSDMLPVLDNHGLIVIDQYANEVRLADGGRMTLDTFRLKGVWGLTNEELISRAHMLVDSIEAVFSQKIDNDLLHRVCLRAAVPWQGVDMVRAYLGYARQIGLGYTFARYREILLAQPAMVHSLWELFQVRLDPAFQGDRGSAYAALSERCQDQLRGIDDHDQDIVFRTLFNLIDSTLRTNFYRQDRVDWYISYKLDHARIWKLPEPRLMVEIYVHHRVVEGLHLRGGPIARGGIRWSDRSDFRQEILDLVNTQMVKNVLIVPEGAKGGFFMKKSVADRDERRKRADDLYEILVRGMLDLTDNIVEGAVVHPPQVVRHDGDDPYLVVAADKGTAHLSDRANRLSRSYGFWLDDAFASGGSNGYDHKKVGITARGGWVLAARHFREMGRDPYSQDFTCVGVGDPAGDVFGNGVIETPHLRLLAAFNHAHVFIDPDPDTARSTAELRRLFDEVKGWESFDTSILSAGGGIYSRRAKSIKLSPQAQRMLGSLQDELPVDAVIRLILRMDVDLLWNGGIGTYVKASHETHAQAKDPTNDELRINADELRCRIVGEGGNLGFSPAARIEYALGGGRINTDAIDNSGGVDMSDHEVNLKILLSMPLASGAMDMEQRNALLESLTETVAGQVLSNSDTHGRQLSLDQLRSAKDPLFYWPTIQWATARSGRSAAALTLPSHELLKHRASARLGLARPELAVLQAHVKMHVFKDLMKEDPAIIPDFDGRVRRYFPAEIQSQLGDWIGQHMLYRHIGMTVVTSEVCGDAGAAYFPSVMELTGATAAQAAAAWIRAMELVDRASLRQSLDQAGLGEEARNRAWTALTEAVLPLVATWLAPGEPTASAAELAAIRQVLARLPEVRGSSHLDRIVQRQASFRTLGIPAELGGRLAALGELSVAREIAVLSLGQAPTGAADALGDAIVRYLAIGEASRLLPSVRALLDRQTQDRWDPVAMGILLNRYIMLMRQLFAQVAVGDDIKLGIDRLAQNLARQGTGPLAGLQSEIDLILGDDPGLATLLVAEERVRAWLARNPAV